MRGAERMKLVNSIEKIFFDQAFQTFNEKHPGSTNKIKSYLLEDEDYLVKYYNTLTKTWLNYLEPKELQQILIEKISNGTVNPGFTGSEHY